MESPTNLETIAQRVKARAEKVRSKKTDVVSKMTRGVLGVERWLKDRGLENKESKVELPRPLEAVEKGQESFFNVLHDIEGEIMTSLRRQHPLWAPEQFPKLNMCGYTSSAITEFLRGQGVDAGVVYGHYRNNGEVKYHYWTEARVGGAELCCRCYIWAI